MSSTAAPPAPARPPAPPPPSLQRSFDRLCRLLADRLPHARHAEPGEGLVLELAGGPARPFGNDPQVTLLVRGRRGLSALASLDVTAVGEAYLAGHLDVRGDLKRLLALRDVFRDRHPLASLYRFVRPLLFGRVASDRAWISRHYDEDAEFYLTFMDERHRAYSQGVFERDDEPLEDAITRKLEFALEAAHIRPGDRVLDVGGGWGSFSEYAGRRGVRVTSLTISEPSERFIHELIDAQGLPCRVLREHFFEHRPDAPYDAIVNLGVTEHLPDYAATLRRYAALLKPGGRVYLDASATRVKHDVSSFFERHIFPGDGSPLCLHDYLRAVAGSPMEVEYVINDRRNYELTTRVWAERLEAAREQIERRWGSVQFRRFQVYLWGCVDGFERDVIQAYRWGLRRV